MLPYPNRGLLGAEYPIDVKESRHPAIRLRHPEAVCGIGLQTRDKSLFS